MRKIKQFDEFLNEIAGSGLFRGAWSGLMQAIDSKSGVVNSEVEKVEKPSSAGSSKPVSSTVLAKADLSDLNAVPGTDDFALYMQHQQGIAGAKGLIEAAAGIGKIHPETLKKKTCSRLGGVVPYANLQCNVPANKDSYRKQIVAALDKGDEKTGATLFLKMWKEDWEKFKKTAKEKLDKPELANLKALFQKYCTEFGVPFDFAITVAKIESNFDPKAGNKRYKGIYALDEAQFKKYVPNGNIFNAEDNIKAGVQSLKNNVKLFTKSLGTYGEKLKIGSWAYA